MKLSQFTKDDLLELAADKKEYLCAVVSYLMTRARAFTVFDFGALKLALLSLGVLIGSHFSSFFKRHRAFVLITFAVSYLFLIWRIFVQDMDE